MPLTIRAYDFALDETVEVARLIIDEPGAGVVSQCVAGVPAYELTDQGTEAQHWEDVSRAAASARRRTRPTGRTGLYESMALNE